MRVIDFRPLTSRIAELQIGLRYIWGKIWPAVAGQ